MVDIDTANYKSEIKRLERELEAKLAQAPVVAEIELLTESKNMILQGVVDLLKSARDNNSLITERMLIGITNKINAAEALLKESKS